MADTSSYLTRRAELETYFDRTAVEAWAKLTSNAKLSGIRATVRAGREAMRATLLSFLPQELGGARVLDAGCGTGLLSVELARRGAEVVACDISPTLIALAGERLPADLGRGHIDFRVGDMLDEGLGRFDYVVAMDSLIHYPCADIRAALERLGARTERAIAFTFAPRTPALTAMHTVGRLFPRGDRAPAIEPVGERTLNRAIAASLRLSRFRLARSRRISLGFYTSQAQELIAR